MFIHGCLRFFGLQRPSSENNGERLCKDGKSLRKTFWELLTRCGTSKKNLSGRKQQERRQPLSSVTLIATREIVETNKEELKAFENKDVWTIVRVLGAGAFGEVILIKNVESNKMVAKKIVPLRQSQTSYEYTGEELLHVQLKHPNIVNLFCWEMLESKLHMFMEYCDGGSIKENINKIERKNDLCYSYFHQMIEGVEYLHARGVAHRDLKPDNLLLTKDGVLKIADFGLAAIFMVDGKELELEGRFGTRAYMAPEVVRDRVSSYLGPPIDLWSCGVTLIYMITGDLPWDEATPENRYYKMWLEKNRKLKKLRPWCLLDKTSRSIVKLLLEPDPVLRVTSWWKHHQN
ncbi:serine/threonine-protein kinase Chk1-like [Oratosquilla oratoria]|uniref:serine/threonine-protein kinase Chk1-like n=1 Tax=Oratosquilla oratoria TaxID=337810 RepID=UPI003F76BFB7